MASVLTLFTALRMLKHRACKVCGSNYHTAGYHKPKKPLKRSITPIKMESDKARGKRITTYKIWIKLNPPDEYGYWDCYLRISSLCPKRINREMLILEHVYPKIKYPALKYEPKNIKPSCAFCNRLKQSNTVQQLAKTFPHIAIMISKPEWKVWEASLPVLR